MKCLTNEQLQRLVDGEIAYGKSGQYQQHLAVCPECRERYNVQKTLTGLIKGLIHDAAKSPVEIPEFKIPVSITKPHVKVRWIPFWAEVAAVLVPVLFIWKMSNKPMEGFKPTAENIRTYEMCHDVDANTAFQKNMITTTVTDDKGNIIECSTN